MKLDIRDFFPKIETDMLEYIVKKDIELTKHEKRRKKFKFSMCGIKPGSVIVFVPDERITAIVLDDTHIEINGRRTSMSAFAKNYYGWHSAKGPWYFSYDGRRISEMDWGY